MVAMVRSGGFWEKRSDHSDHRRDHRRDHSTFVEKHEVTLVTITLFGVLARGAQGHGTKRDIWDKTKHLGQNETKLNTTCLTRQVREEQQGHGTQRKQTQNEPFRRQIQSSLASERCILEPKGTNRRQICLSSVSPCFKG